jgi:hypothetical protein
MKVTQKDMFRLSSLTFKVSFDYASWIATDGVRCISAPTITECVERAARIMNWGSGEFPSEENGILLTNDQ